MMTSIYAAFRNLVLIESAPNSSEARAETETQPAPDVGDNDIDK
jgi:hypothetical protein